MCVVRHTHDTEVGGYLVLHDTGLGVPVLPHRRRRGPARKLIGFGNDPRMVFPTMAEALRNRPEGTRDVIRLSGDQWLVCERCGAWLAEYAGSRDANARLVVAAPRERRSVRVSTPKKPLSVMSHTHRRVLDGTLVPPPEWSFAYLVQSKPIRVGDPIRLAYGGSAARGLRTAPLPV